MNDDLLNRLRARGDYDPNNDFLCDEAADEIERLREQVRLLIVQTGDLRIECSDLQAKIDNWNIE